MGAVREKDRPARADEGAEAEFQLARRRRRGGGDSRHSEQREWKISKPYDESGRDGVKKPRRSPRTLAEVVEARRKAQMAAAEGTPADYSQ